MYTTNLKDINFLCLTLQKEVCEFCYNDKTTRTFLTDFDSIAEEAIERHNFIKDFRPWETNAAMLMMIKRCLETLALSLNGSSLCLLPCMLFLLHPWVRGLPMARSLTQKKKGKMKYYLFWKTEILKVNYVAWTKHKTFESGKELVCGKSGFASVVICKLILSLIIILSGPS